MSAHAQKFTRNPMVASTSIRGAGPAECGEPGDAVPAVVVAGTSVVRVLEFSVIGAVDRSRRFRTTDLRPLLTGLSAAVRHIVAGGTHGTGKRDVRLYVPTFRPATLPGRATSP